VKETAFFEGRIRSDIVRSVHTSPPSTLLTNVTRDPCEPTPTPLGRVPRVAGERTRGKNEGEEGAMSAQGGTIAGRPPMQLPTRPIALLLAAVTAAAVGMTAIRMTGQDARVEPALANAQRFWGPTTGHPVLRDRDGIREASAMPVQRLYPDGFDGPTTYTPILDDVRRKW
jgi:hypothetical protein